MSKALESIKRAAVRGRRGPNRAGEYSINCPFCEVQTGEPDTKFKLQLNPKKGAYHCYRCEAGGFVDMEWLKLPVLEDAVQTARPEANLGPPDGFHWLHKNAAAVSMKPYVEYLKKRGVYEQALECGAGACTSGRYAGRIVFPCFKADKNHADSGTSQISFKDGKQRAWDENAKWLGFSARGIYKGMEPKYLYPTGMDRTNNLWGLHARWTEDVYIVEGVFDALPLWPGAVACFGKNVTEPQIDRMLDMRKHGSRLIVCLDGDAWEEGQVLAMRLAFRGAEDTLWCRLPPGTDPGTLGKQVTEFIVRP